MSFFSTVIVDHIYINMYLAIKYFDVFQVEMGGARAPISTFIVEPFVPHDDEFYMWIMSERLSSTISFSECGVIEIEENWDKVP